jgi:ABC-type nickel/cobalt efflux system permease component RcnA
MIKRYRRLFFAAITLMAMLALAPVIMAHPLGNFTVNRYSRLEVGTKQIDLIYVVDMAEIPTFQERPFLDSNSDGAITPIEEEHYLQNLVTTLAGNLRLVINDTPLRLEAQAQELTFPPGQGDLPTTRVRIHFTAVLPPTLDTWQVTYHDYNYTDRLGWQEVAVQSKSGARLLESTVPAQDISRELRNYPQDLLQNPPTVSQAAFSLAKTAVSPATNEGTRIDVSPVEVQQALTNEALTSANRFSQDNFADLLSVTLAQPGAIGLALLVAFGLGAAHALTPGHGKTIVAAYLVGSRGTARHALFLGLTTTITHTAGVFAFGLLLLFASRFILPEQLYPWLGVLSGLLVIFIGFTLFRNRLSSWLGAKKPADHHSQLPGYHYHLGYGHTHAPADSGTNWRNLLALGVSGGLLPCPSALVLLLSAIALQRVAFGLLLILIFSLGLASVLTGIGIVLVYAGRLFERMPRTAGRLGHAVPVFSALFITLVGVAITCQALVQTGILRL